MSGADEFLLYTAPNGAVRITVAVFNESVWLPQRGLAELFGVKVPAISKHLKNIFDSGELVESAVVSVLETTASDGKVDVFRKRQDAGYISDFDREIQRIEGKKP